MIKISAIGYNHSHEEGFAVDCPNGPGAWLFLLIKSPTVMIVCGERYSIKSGSAMIISPTSPCSYRAQKGIYTDDWFFFDAGDEDIAALEETGIPFDRPIYLGASDDLSKMVYNMTIEYYSTSIHHDKIVRLYTEILFSRISRICAEKTTGEAHTKANRRADLAYLRSRIYREPAELPSVAELAKELGMSLSNLEHFYKKTFGVSVLNDIINSRITQAQNLLLSSNLLISEIAKKCGYNNCYTFMTQFRQKTGMTPTYYRKKAAAGKYFILQKLQFF